MTEQFNWDDGPFKMNYYGTLYENVSFKPSRHTPSTIYDIFDKNGARITDVYISNGSGFSYAKIGESDVCVTKMKPKENMMYGEIKPQPVQTMSDEELSKEFRTLDSRYYELFKELDNRGYTMTDVDGDEFTVYALYRIYKNTVTEL